jgi:uncharacterized protein
MKCLLFSLVILPISVFAEGGLPNQPYVYVVGRAGIEKPPDVVTLRFDVVARAPDQPKANAQVQATANKILDLLKGHKIADTDVIAEDLRSEADFEQTESYPRSRGKLIGYVVTRPFTVKVRDITAFPKLVDELIAVGNVEFTGMEPGLSKEKELGSPLWDKAIANAREQADKTLKQTGMKIDSVFAISPIPFPEIQTKIFGETERVIVTGSNIPTAQDRVPSEYRLAPVALSETVHVIYLISPAK